VRHAIDFSTWQSLTATGLHADAATIVVALIEATATA